MKFEDYKYERPDMTVYEQTFKAAIKQFKEATTLEAQSATIDTINHLRFDFETMQTLASIRHTIDTRDEFYDKEEDFFNENRPVFEQLNNQFYKALENARFKDELRKEKGDLLFDMVAQSLRTFDDAILEDLKKENKLSSEYQKLLASADIDFEGESRNLSQMSPFMQSKDRDTRKSASRAVSSFFEENEETFDRIYDELVHTRHAIATKLGYDNFVSLAYDRLGRLDYNADDVANYRQQVKETLVPLVSDLITRQSKRLGIEEMKSYDLPLSFLSGNPTPKGKKDWMVDKARVMYREMSPETDEFFTFMTEKNLLDLEAKKGKSGGGYCTFIPNYQSPFIFANFNGTSHDVDVLTHEAGHAFQIYQSRHIEVSEYIWPTLEACEIHSMSMEFLAWPWMDSFFEEDTDKYKFNHVASALTFVPYGVAIDEYQHTVYENPTMTPAERKAAWREIEKTYLPYKVYDNDPFLERGGAWMRQSHVYEVPFYYIDYTLAQICAFQYWKKSNEDRKKAWQSYLKLCKLGGSKSFLNLLKEAGLYNPFEDGAIASITPSLKAFLDSIDDTKL